MGNISQCFLNQFFKISESSAINKANLFVDGSLRSTSRPWSAWMSTNMKPLHHSAISLRRVLLISGTLSGGAYCSYLSSPPTSFWPLSLRKELIDGKNEQLALKLGESFCHPFDEKPLWWRILLISKRILVLAWCFAPFFAMSILMMIMGSKECR